MSYAPVNAEQRLIEWAKEKHSPGWDIPCATGGALGRLADDGRDERMKKRKYRNRTLALERRLARKRLGLRTVPCKETAGIRMEIVTVDGDSVACPPDGGMGAMVERMAASIEMSNRCRVLGEIIEMMPLDLLSFVRATYYDCVGVNEIPRPYKEAMRMMGVEKSVYFERKAKTLEWITERLGLRQARAA